VWRPQNMLRRWHRVGTRFDYQLLNLIEVGLFSDKCLTR
jgi:hypothetical protein